MGIKERLTATLGCTQGSLAMFRIGLGVLLTIELVMRFRFLKPFYSDEGTLPVRLVTPKVDGIFKVACFHLNFETEAEQSVLLALQTVLSVLFTIGFRTDIVAPLSWYWYLSLTLRNTWMSYILDRYFHYLLFLSMFLPLDECLSVSRKNGDRLKIVINPGTIFLKALVLWIYIDAGWGKYMDPLGGWTYHADPLPALDTYARHTVPAQYLYAILGPEGLRMMTPTVVWVELLAAPLTLTGLFFGIRSLVQVAICLIVSLHLGIAITLRNSALLSFVACVPWLACIPGKLPSKEHSTMENQRSFFAVICLLAMVGGNLWLETISQACDQSVNHIWSTVFHNRWNVFVGAEEYVTWEIGPGELADGSIIDVWGRRDEVNWNLPGGGAPCTATSRPGRWRSFPYLAELDGEDGDALWSYLCREWDDENDATSNPGRRLVRYNFFMLQADVLPNMGFGPTRKRLIKSYDCAPDLIKSKTDDPLNTNDEL